MGLDVHARSVAAAGLDTVTGQVWKQLRPVVAGDKNEARGLTDLTCRLLAEPAVERIAAAVSLGRQADVVDRGKVIVKVLPPPCVSA